MCGIMGYIAMGNNKPDFGELTYMFSALQVRGHDAAGYAFIEDGQLIVRKQAVKSAEFVTMPEWMCLKDKELPRIMIAHTRARTQGSEKNNMNNHPLFNKQGMAIVHNGIINNDNEIFISKPRDAQVDSEAILAVLSTGAKDPVKKVFEKVSGSFAVAMIEVQKPDRLTLFKHSNPIELYLDKNKDILYFCSQRDIMQAALNIDSVTYKGFTIGEGDFQSLKMEDDHCLIINFDGVVSYEEHTPKSIWSGSAYGAYGAKDYGYYRGSYYGYNSKKKEEDVIDDREDDNWIECSNCLQYFPAEEVIMVDKNWGYCPECGQVLEFE